MSRLTHNALQHVEELSQRHGFSADALTHLCQAVADGDGRMAEFDHPEFGGPAMWMAGGMLMLSDSANHALKARVDAACNDIAALLAREPALKSPIPPMPAASHQSQSQHQHGGSSSASWSSSLSMAGGTDAGGWPAELGRPSVTGSQNGMRYAWFSETCRLAIDDDSGLHLYDTGDHRITGVSQQQSNASGTMTLTSQHGPIALAELPRVSEIPREPEPATAPEKKAQASARSSTAPPGEPAAGANGETIFTAIERLGELKERGLLTADEFDTKKRELLSRL